MKYEVDWFTDLMRSKLDDNAHKPYGPTHSTGYLLRRLMEEVGEMVEAYGSKSAEEMAYECADVANFAMFIALRIRLADGGYLWARENPELFKTLQGMWKERMSDAKKSNP